jgi:hypothetical protein
MFAGTVGSVFGGFVDGKGVSGFAWHGAEIAGETRVQGWRREKLI